MKKLLLCLLAITAAISTAWAQTPKKNIFGLRVGMDTVSYTHLDVYKRQRVDGVYTADPEKDPAAEKFYEITFDEVYRRNLKVMDMTAFTLCRENGLRVIVFDMDTPGNLEKVLAGEKIGTLVKL